MASTLSFPVSLQVTVPMALIHFDAWFGACRGEQQRPLLRHRAPLHHAPLRHHLHCRLQVEDEQAAGIHHVPPLHRLPGGQRHAGGQDPHLPHFHLTHIHFTHTVQQRTLSAKLRPFSSKQELEIKPAPQL